MRAFFSYQYWRSALVVLLLLFAVVKLMLLSRQFHFSINLLKAMSLVQLLVFGGLLLSSVRYLLLVQQRWLSYRWLFKATSLGAGLSVVLPGRTAELIKPAYLFKHINLAMTRGFAGLGVEKMLDLITLGMICLLLISSSLVKHASLIGGGLLGLCLIVLILFPYCYPALIKMTQLIPAGLLRNTVRGLLEQLLVTVRLRCAMPSLLVSVPLWLCSSLSFYLFFHSILGAQVTIVSALSMLVLSSIGGVVPLLPAGFGFYEAGIVFVLLKTTRVGLAKALALALCMHFSQLLLPATLSFLILFRDRLGLSELVKLSMRRIRSI